MAEKSTLHGAQSELRAQGKSLRAKVSRSSQGEWAVQTNRKHTLDLLANQESQRLPFLIEERRKRMSVSAFTFFRGSALLMASDLAKTPSTGLEVQTCGDAHIANFGGYASADRKLVFDINDFDETAPGPWEWDVKRLMASIEICGRDRGFKRSWRRACVQAAAQSYAHAMESFSHKGALDVWYARLDVQMVLDRALPLAAHDTKQQVKQQLSRAYSKTSDRAFNKLLSYDEDRIRIAFDPPYLVPLDQFAPAINTEQAQAAVVDFLARYRESLDPHLRVLFDKFDYLDAAQKVVGVGSVGTRAWIVALVGKDCGEPLMLQIKEAQQSVVEQFYQPAEFATAGERVVEGQRLMQASSDVLLGWARTTDQTGHERDYYVRQLWDWKTSTDLETADAGTIAVTGCMCGWALARAHARSGHRCAIAGYLGTSDAFADAMVKFSAAYADQNEADYRTFMDALSSGNLPLPDKKGAQQSPVVSLGRR